MIEYDYEKAVYNDCIDFIKENINRIKGMTQEKAYEELYDDAFMSDSVTGNTSGSYTFNAWRAEECLCHNMYLFADACEEFSETTDLFRKGAEACDVTIRCYLLSSQLYEALNDLESEYNTPEEDEENEEEE